VDAEPSSLPRSCALLLLLFCAPSACGSGGTVDEGTGSAVRRNPACPEEIPQGGAPCFESASCEYDRTVYHGCSTEAVCSITGNVGASTWQVSIPEHCAARSPLCPAAFGTLAIGAPCPPAISAPSFFEQTKPVTCDYAQGRCGCIACEDSALHQGSKWSCSVWGEPVGWSGPKRMDCPRPRPLAGDACDTPDLECSYGNPCNMVFGQELCLAGGYWHATLLRRESLCPSVKCEFAGSQ
jgi:hypothetical protein